MQGNAHRLQPRSDQSLPSVEKRSLVKSDAAIFDAAEPVEQGMSHRRLSPTGGQPVGVDIGLKATA